jgi:hypothetical protein
MNDCISNQVMDSDPESPDDDQKTTLIETTDEKIVCKNGVCH